MAGKVSLHKFWILMYTKNWLMNWLAERLSGTGGNVGTDAVQWDEDKRFDVWERLSVSNWAKVGARNVEEVVWWRFASVGFVELRGVVWSWRVCPRRVAIEAYFLRAAGKWFWALLVVKNIDKIEFYWIGIIFGSPVLCMFSWGTQALKW